MAAEEEELKKTDLFRRLDDGTTAFCVSVLSPQGGFTMAANARYEALFRKASDMVADSDVRKSINTFTVAAMVAPDDRTE